MAPSELGLRSRGTSQILGTGWAWVGAMLLGIVAPLENGCSDDAEGNVPGDAAPDVPNDASAEADTSTSGDGAADVGSEGGTKIPPILFGGAAIAAVCDFGEVTTFTFDSESQALGAPQTCGGEGLTRDVAVDPERGLVFQAGGSTPSDLTVQQVTSDGACSKATALLETLSANPSLLALAEGPVRRLMVLTTDNQFLPVDLDEDGLPSAEGTPVAVDDSYDPVDFVVAPGGEHLYLGNDSGAFGCAPDLPCDNIHAYAIASDGTPSEFGSATDVHGTLSGIAITPDGKYLYAALQDRVEGFKVGADGSLSELVNASIKTSIENRTITVSPTGQHLVTTHFDSASFSIFEIAADGSLELTADSPIDVDGRAVNAVFDPNGRAVFVAALREVNNPSDDALFGFETFSSTHNVITGEPLEVGCTYPQHMFAIPLDELPDP